jgi:hypothetical protein
MLPDSRRLRPPFVRTIRIRIGSQVETFQLHQESLIDRKASVERVSALHALAKELVEAGRAPTPRPSHEPSASARRIGPLFDFTRVPVDFRPLEESVSMPNVNDGFANDAFEMGEWLGDLNAESWTGPSPWMPGTDYD